MPAPNPITSTLKINGSVIPRSVAGGTGVVLSSISPISRGGIPELRFAVRNIPWTSLPDPYTSKSAELLIDFGDGLGSVTVFKGDCWSLGRTPSHIKHIREYHCTGLRDRADRVSVFDENTGVTSLTFNARRGDREYLASRSGRTVGQAIIETLSQATTVAALSSLGIGAFSGVGSGASAHCVMSGRAVSFIVVDVPGSGYDATNRVTVKLYGGGGTGAAAGLYSVSAGGISSIPVASGGGGYTSPPQVVFSKLPALTVADLEAIDTIPMVPITISGDRILNAIEGALEDRNPNYWVDVQPTDGLIRFLDQRKFGSTTCTLSGGSPVRPALIVPVVLNGGVESLWVADGGWGYGSAPSIAFADSFGGSGASYTLSIDGNGSVRPSVTRTAKGTGYSGGRAPFVIDSAPLLQEGFTPGRDVRNCFQRVQILGATYNQPICLKLSDGTLIENFAHDGLNNAQSKFYWKLDDFVNPNEVGSTAVAGTVGLTSGVVTSIPVGSPGYGYPASSTVAVSIAPAPGAGFIASVAVNTTTGVVTGVTVVSGGSGFDGPTPTFRVVGGGATTNATFTVTVVSGSITAVGVATGGVGYTYAPTYILTGVGAGTGATAHATTNPAGNVNSPLVIDSGGSGYSRPPIAKIAGHGGSAARSSGSVVMIDTLTARLTPNDGLATWGTNYWDQTDAGIHGTLFMTYTDGVGVVNFWAARAVSNTAQTAGATSDVTLDAPAPNLNFTSYDFVGDATPGSRVWRSYLPANAAIRGLLQDDFSWPIAVGNSDGTMVIKKNSRFAKVVYTPAGTSKTVEKEWGFDLNRETGEIMFNVPVVSAYGTPGNLAIGGGTTDGIPTDVQVWLPMRSKALTATWPPDILTVPQYSGDSHTNEGMSFTKLYHNPSWIDPSQLASQTNAAHQIHDTLKDAVVEGSVSLDSCGRALFIPGMACGFSLLDGTACGLESAKIPVVSTSIQWAGEGPLINPTSLTVSSRRAHYTGATAIPPAQGYTPVWPGDGGGSRTGGESGDMLGGAALGGPAMNGMGAMGAGDMGEGGDV